MNKKFSPSALAKLNVCYNKYYVYRLIDPRTYETFYVGKGTGQRIFQHVKEAQKLISNDEDSNSLKIQQIQSILNAQKEVICMIHRWGLTEDEAFEVEAALIDAYPGLTNIQSGHGSDFGLISVEDFENIANVNEYDEPKENYIIIKTTQKAIDANGSLYEATRRSWNAKLDNAKKYKYVFSVVNGVVQEIYEISRENDWYKMGDRIAFEGKVCQNSELTKLKGMMIPAKYRQRGAANPFIYKK